MAVANIIIYLFWTCSVWILLRQYGISDKQTFLVTALFSLYPDILLSVNRIDPSIVLASAVLLAFMATVLQLIRSQTGYPADIGMGIILGVAIVSRPNLLLLLPLSWLLFWRFKLPWWLLRVSAQGLIAFVVYAVVCMSAHGAVFWPHMGPYNLFAGANEYTEGEMMTQYEDAAEGTITMALKDRGIIAYHDWNRPDNLPDDNETRNLKFEPIYKREALKFMETHPLTMVKLTAVKLLDLLRPDLWVHKGRSVAGVLKILAACLFPLWLIARIALPRPGEGIVGAIVPYTVIAYMIPFLITISAPRFRIALDVMCLTDLVAVCFAWRAKQSLDSAPICADLQIC
ncbi:MAG: hypothetical protein WBQ94_09585 [Terracidiphilus sp.]